MKTTKGTSKRPGPNQLVLERLDAALARNTARLRHTEAQVMGKAKLRRRYGPSRSHKVAANRQTVSHPNIPTIKSYGTKWKDCPVALAHPE